MLRRPPLLAGAPGLITLSIDRWISADTGASLKRLQDMIIDTCPEPVPTEPTPLQLAGRPDGYSHPLADPTWVHDPSGYVYEVFEDVRLEGVTATVQHAETSAGPWEVWDAEWFLQDNPLITDGEGRYGWDVPEGWWRVRYDKDGHATAYSEVLEVLPPHFDVNIGMRSLQPPALAATAAIAADTSLEVVFDGFVDAATLDSDTIEVWAGTEQLTGLVGAATPPGGGTSVPLGYRPPDGVQAACPAGRYPSGRFSAVSGTHAEAIDCAAGWAIAAGYPDGTFRPGDRLTRGQLASVLVRLLDAAGHDWPDTIPDAFGDDDGSTQSPTATPRHRRPDRLARQYPRCARRGLPRPRPQRGLRGTPDQQAPPRLGPAPEPERATCRRTTITPPTTRRPTSTRWRWPRTTTGAKPSSRA